MLLTDDSHNSQQPIFAASPNPKGHDGRRIRKRTTPSARTRRPLGPQSCDPKPGPSVIGAPHQSIGLNQVSQSKTATCPPESEQPHPLTNDRHREPNDRAGETLGGARAAATRRLASRPLTAPAYQPRLAPNRPCPDCESCHPFKTTPPSRSPDTRNPSPPQTSPATPATQTTE